MKEEIKIKNNDPLELKFRINFANLRKPVNFVVWCKEEFAITTADNNRVLKKMYEVEDRLGNKIKIINKGLKVILIQKYKNKTKEEILEKIKKEIRKSSGGNLEKQ